MKKYEYYQPKSLDEAFRLKEEFKDRARYIAGGTDLIVRIKQVVLAPDALISLTGIGELRGVEQNGDMILGSMTLIRELEKDGRITGDYPALTEAASALASPQIRNVATLGGNLGNAAPSADCAPPLLALEAVLTLESPGGTREVPIDEFFKGPGRTCCDTIEILTRIRIPPRSEKAGMAFLKVGRVNQDIAVTNAAVLLVMEKNVCVKCRIAVGAVAPVPLRLKETEKLIENREISEELLELAGKMVEREVSPITDIRSTEEYRRIVTGVMVRRAIKQAFQRIV